MKLYIAAALLAVLPVAPAAAADFAGARIGANLGFADDDFAGTEAFTYGVELGYDWDLGKTVIGATAEWQNSDEDGIGRDLSVAGRFGFKAGENVLAYGLLGYTNLSVLNVDLDGVRVGTGVEFGMSEKIFGKVEYRYSDYELDAETHQMLVGVGVRF